MPKSDLQKRLEMSCFGRVFTDSEDEKEDKPISESNDVEESKVKKKKRGKRAKSASVLEGGNDEPKKIAKTVPVAKDGPPIVWKDEDDEISDEEGIRSRKGFYKVKGKADTKYRVRLEENFQLVYGPTPSWAITGGKKQKKHPDSDDNDSDEVVGILGKSDPKFLPRNELSILKVLDLNNEGHERDVIRSVEFHPKLQVGLVAGAKKKVSLYTVDGKSNPLVQSVEFEDTALNQATFSADGSEFYVSSGKMNHFWTYDIMSGKISRARPSHLTRNETIRKLVPSPDNKILVTLGHHGNIYLHSKESNEVIATLHTNGEVNDVTFSPSGSFMFASTVQGEIYQWDMKTRDCILKVTDDGSINSTRIAVSPWFLACGSSSGVVNIYDLQDLKQGSYPKPVKAFMNLTTGITSLKFNNTGEILAMASLEKPNAVRLAHIPSMTVYSNFPYVNTFWNRTNSIAFSPNSGYFSLGNNQGSAYLFRISHYDNY